MTNPDRTPRVKGHAYEPGKAGKFNDKCKPRCKCGWVGFAGNASQARAQYRDHVTKAAAKACPDCAGSGVAYDFGSCPSCGGSGKA